MAGDPRKRQKKMERRTAKRKEKKHALVRQENPGLMERLTAAARCPILDCWIGADIANQGIGWVLLSREFPNGQVAVANFLVDVYCLGVKNVHVEVLGRFSYDSKYVRQMAKQMNLQPALPADARKLLEEAVAYARGLGLPPHPDYAKAMHIFGDVAAADSKAMFEFGKDGKPLFIAGPNDTPERSRQIMAILSNTRGQGKFDFILPLSAPPSDKDFHIVGPNEEAFDDLEDFGDEAE
jgi:hypothetical protein